MTVKAAGIFNWKPVIGFWLVLAALLIARSFIFLHDTPLDGDSAMRMVTASDLFGGQNWQDTDQHRDNTPYGTAMHWSRLVDAPIAALIWLLRPLAGAGATDLAAQIWPPLLLLPLLTLCVMLTRRLVPEAGPFTALALPFLPMSLLPEFSPGRVDHHNVQIILTMALVLAVIESRNRPRAAILSGILAATCLAIGMETLAFVIVAIIAYGVFWVLDPARYLRAVRWFAVSFPLATLGHFLLANRQAQYFSTYCDALSPVYVTAGATTGVAFLAAIYAGRHLSHARSRLLLMATLGVLAGALTLVLFPICAQGPYAQVDPFVYNTIFPVIVEAQPLWVLFADMPAIAIGMSAATIIALLILVGICFRSRGEERGDWLVLLAFFAVGVIVMMLQTRGARLAAAFIVPVGAWTIVQARAYHLKHQSAGSSLGLVGSWLLFAGTLHWLAVGYGLSRFERPVGAAMAATPVLSSSVTDEGGNCLANGAYRTLASLPASKIMAPMHIGPFILFHTPHSVVSAGYHRNNAGTADVLNFFNDSEAKARAIVKSRGLDYLVVCDGLRELYGFNPAPDSFVAMYSKHERWDWLEPISPPGTALAIYRFHTENADGPTQ